LSNAAVLAVVWQRGENHANVPYFSPAVLLLLAFQVHLVRRLVETLWVMRYPQKATMHVMAYAFGMSYYIIVPVTYYCAYVAGQDAAVATTGTPALYVGLVTFAAGSLVQCHTHYLLANLGDNPKSKSNPKSNSKSGSTDAYVIPRGGLFSLVSCPHYFGEVVIYLGLATMGMTVAEGVYPWYPFVWVVVNLTLAARMTHRWYLAHFKTYDRLGRRALVPFLY
jgi:3-oxo-5-alpha-steroid 4-dehydrogenase 3